MPLKQHIESHLPKQIETHETAQFLSWLKEVLYILVHIVDKEKADAFIHSTVVPEGGLNVSLYQFYQAFKNGRQATFAPTGVRAQIQAPGYTGIYQPTTNFPIAVHENGMLYIYPGGGTIEGFGVSVPENLDGEEIENMPTPFRIAAIYYVVMMAYRKYMTESHRDKELQEIPSDLSYSLTIPELTKESFTDTITLSDYPTPPVDPAITADQASDPSVTAPTISAPDLSSEPASQYVKVNPSVDYQDAIARFNDDDIEMLNGEISRLANELQQEGLKMNDELNRVNTEIRGFQAKVEHSLEQGRLTLSATDSDAQLKLNRELTNAQNKLQALIEEKRQILSNYQAQVSAIASENQTEIARFSSAMEKWAKDNDLHSLEFSTRVNFMLSKYQNDLQSQLSEIQSKTNVLSQRNSIVDSHIQHYGSMMQLYYERFISTIRQYIQFMQNEKYVPAPVNPQAPE